jgi:hypothetical protein
MIWAVILDRMFVLLGMIDLGVSRINANFGTS